MNNLNVRTCKYEKDGLWEDISPIDIKKGMVFMMFEPDGEVVIGDNGSVTMKAAIDAYIDKNGIIGIQIETD
jgi:hypothetical protein